jgi:hypothetical protein
MFQNLVYTRWKTTRISLTLTVTLVLCLIIDPSPMCNVFDVYRVDVAAQELVRVESLGDEVLCTLEGQKTTVAQGRSWGASAR